MKFFLKYLGEMVGVGTGAGARAEIFDKLEPENGAAQNGPAPQH
jgi:hypothetical protein